jgi:hypothetical protein
VNVLVSIARIAASFGIRARSYPSRVELILRMCGLTMTLHRTTLQSAFQPVRDAAGDARSSSLLTLRLGCPTLARLLATTLIALSQTACSEDEAICKSLPGAAIELASTPREDENLELLAIKLSHHIVASADIYDRLRDDVAAIRTLDGQTRTIHYTPRHDGSTLLLSFTPAVRKAVNSGDYHSWACLNKHFRTRSIETGANGLTKVTFDGNYEMGIVAALYAKLPGVRVAEPLRPTLNDQSFTLCVTPAADHWHYVFSDAQKTLHYFVSSGDKRVEPVGTWSLLEGRGDQTAQPDWVARYWNEEACR